MADYGAAPGAPTNGSGPGHEDFAQAVHLLKQAAEQGMRAETTRSASEKRESTAAMAQSLQYFESALNGARACRSPSRARQPRLHALLEAPALTLPPLVNRAPLLTAALASLPQTRTWSRRCGQRWRSAPPACAAAWRR